MIEKYRKLIIFDLDGVLMESRELHYNALNEAIMYVTGEAWFSAMGQEPDYLIGREEHLSKYDGLPTKKKLQMLTREKGLPAEWYDMIYNRKQETTRDLLLQMPRNDNLIKIMDCAANVWKYKIAVASNSIRDTVKTAIYSLGLMPYVDYYISNEDVKRPKPHPEMYWKCMTELNAVPATTVIIEDSHIGREGAIASGAQLLAVENPVDLTYSKINGILGEKETGVKARSIPWVNKKMNVLIPMAGAGSRFQAAGYTFPKPLIEVNGKPMIQSVVENLNMDAHYIFIVQKEHYEKYNLHYMLHLIAPNCDIVQIDGITDGAARTTLMARKLFENDNPLIIANSDQIIEWNSNEVMYSFAADEIDGGILTFKSVHPRWSYAALDNVGFVKEVAEKKVISDNATVGIYYWKKGSDYAKYAQKMIVENDRTNGEFYVAPTFNHAIRDGKKIKIKEIDKMWGIGDPETLDIYLANHKDKK